MKDIYLNVLEQLKIIPNFFVSEEYWEAMGWDVVVIKSGVNMVGDSSKILTVVDTLGDKKLPSIRVDFREYKNDIVAEDYTLLGTHPFEYSFCKPRSMPVPQHYDFCDRQYIYNPSNYIDLNKPQFKLLRKNIKVAQADAGECLIIGEPEKPEDVKIDELLAQWMCSVENRKWYDPQGFLSSVFKCQSLFLIGEKTRKTYALLVYDTNWKYINLRGCLTIPNIRGLSETARIRFFQEMYKIYGHKEINDGGDLGIKGLRFFKERLLPDYIYAIYSSRGASNV